jgi:HD-GYP domain-containing protein (c-di-GMP phosphodiesterase class II)
MTSDRPYRKAMGKAEAIAELQANSGTQFDPEVVDALVAELA